MDIDFYCKVVGVTRPIDNIDEYKRNRVLVRNLPPNVKYVWAISGVLIGFVLIQTNLFICEETFLMPTAPMFDDFGKFWTF
jgi:hypothetical protein